MPAINEVLQQGRYRIIQPLGQNGRGAFYEAYDNVLETKVLFKEISVDLKKAATAAQQETFEYAFADEAKTLTRIKHESLLNIRDYFSETDCHYLVMESVAGNNLSELLEKNKNPFPLAEITNWAEQLLNALQYLHTQTPPIIHRDIKPQNVKLTSSGKIKLLLAIAKNPDDNVNASITNQTLHYLPLEQIWRGLDSASQKVIANSYDEKSEKILEQAADARSDIYALGATLYHLLTGRLPIDALERSIDILEDKPDPLPNPNEINPNIPPEISDVLMKAMALKRENRFHSAVIMRQAWRTASGRSEESNAEAQNQEEDVLEIPFEEFKSGEPERQSAEPKNLENESEKTRQIELIRQQLREAEAKRLEAEQRAAEAEKRLFEKADKDSGGKESSAFVKSPAAHVLPSAGKQSETREHSSDEFKDLFAAPPKNNKVFLRMSAAAGILVMLCGAFWGVWVLLQSKSAEPNQITPSQTMSLTDTAKPEPTVESSPVPNVETTSETGAITAPTLAPDATEASVTSPAVKNRPLPPPRAKKQTLPATKTPAAKKAVTVDDLINDN